MLSGLLALLVSVAGAQEEPAAVNDEVAPKWTVALPNTRCSWSASEHNCHPSSPGVGDLNGDGRLDIVAATKVRKNPQAFQQYPPPMSAALGKPIKLGWILAAMALGVVLGLPAGLGS